MYTATRSEWFSCREGRPSGRPSVRYPVWLTPCGAYFFLVTPMLTRSKMPYSKSITVSEMPFTHGLRSDLVAE